MRPALQPCPFCGEAAEVVFDNGAGGTVLMAFVQCSACGAEAGHVAPKGLCGPWTRIAIASTAAHRWNSRARPRLPVAR